MVAGRGGPRHRLGSVDAVFVFFRMENGMKKQDFQVLVELGEFIAQREHRTGRKSGRSVTSSSITRRHVAEFARKCEQGEISGRKRKRESDRLFLELLRLLDDDL